MWSFIIFGRKHQALTIIVRIGEDDQVRCVELETLEIAGEGTHRQLIQVGISFCRFSLCYKTFFSGRNGTPAETENSNRPSPQPGKEPGETSSVTEDDNSEDDSDSRDAHYRCQHCFTTS